MQISDEAIKAAARALEFHLTDRAQDSGCALRCGYDGDDMASHLAEHALIAAAPLLLTGLKDRLRDYQAMLLEQSEGAEVFAHHATGVGIALRIIDEALSEVDESRG